MVWLLDRLGRPLKDLIGLAERLEDKGVGLRSLQEQIDTTSASGKLFFHIMGALAEFERNLIREYTRAGLEAARRCRKNPGRKRKLNEQNLAVARALLKDDTITVAEVAERLGVLSAALIEKYLVDVGQWYYEHSFMCVSGSFARYGIGRRLTKPAYNVSPS